MDEKNVGWNPTDRRGMMIRILVFLIKMTKASCLNKVKLKKVLDNLTTLTFPFRKAVLCQKPSN